MNYFSSRISHIHAFGISSAVVSPVVLKYMVYLSGCFIVRNAGYVSGYLDEVY